MAQILALLFLLKKLMLKELSSFSSVRFNNFLFSILFIMAAGLESRAPKAAFGSTLFFQIVLLAPLLVTFSIDTWVLAVASALYLVSIFWGEQLWKCSLTA